MESSGTAQPQSGTGLLAITFRKILNFLGFSGVLFIIYGVISAGTGTVWPPLERWVTPLSSFLTILATLLTALSIYFYQPQSHPPERFSRYVSAPAVIAGCALAIITLIADGSLAPVIVNGFALLGIAGGLFRIQPRTVE